MATDRYTANDFVSIQEAALLLGVPHSEVQRYVRVGLLDRYRLRDRYVRVLRWQVVELADIDPELRRMA